MQNLPVLIIEESFIRSEEYDGILTKFYKNVLEKSRYEIKDGNIIIGPYDGRGIYKVWSVKVDKEFIKMLNGLFLEFSFFTIEDPDKKVIEYKIFRTILHPDKKAVKVEESDKRIFNVKDKDIELLIKVPNEAK